VSGTQYPGGLPAPNTNFQGVPQPEVGLIVRLNQSNSHWEDELGPQLDAGRALQPARPRRVRDRREQPRDRPNGVRARRDRALQHGRQPVSGKLYVSNTEARNESRFEGPGVFAGHTVRGHLHEARISIISGATVTPRHLNKHINYAVVPSPAGVKNDSLAIRPAWR